MPLHPFIKDNSRPEKKVLQPNCKMQFMEHDSSGPVGHCVYRNYCSNLVS